MLNANLLFLERGMIMNSKLRFIKRVIKITKLLICSNKLLYTGCFAISIFIGVLPIISAYVWKLLLDSIQYINENKDFFVIINFLILLGIVKLIGVILSDINVDLRSLQADCFNVYLTDKLLDVLNNSQLSCFDDSEYYNDYDMVCNQSLQKSIEIGTSLSSIIISVISIMTSFFVLISLNPVLIFMIMLVGIPSLFAQTTISKKMFRVFESRVEKLRYTQFLKSFMVQYNNIKEIKILNAGGYFKKQILTLYKQYIRENKHLIREFNIKKIIVNFIQLFVSISIQIFLVMCVLKKGHSIGNIVFYLQTYLNAESAIAVIFSDFSRIYESDMYIQKLLAFLERSDSEMTKKIKSEEFTKISFEGVSFSYPDETRKALTNINVLIQKGKSYAIVGKNGSGKSTFVKLLLNLYDQYDGKIFYNSLDLKKYSIKNYSEKFGVIFQDFTRYPLSVRENVGISNTNEIENLKHIIEATTASGANDFIEELPKKYETNLFKQWTSGTDLSIGQWQRIGFARAVFKNGDILVMDEPTSALDAFAEREIVEMANKYCKTQSKTSILISHRLSNVKDADMILVFDQGTIIEQGTHEELMDKKGLYYELFTVQAESYND